MPFENSPQGPNGSWQGPEGWLQNVLDIAGQVAQVVGPLVPIVLGARNNLPGERQPFRTTGPVNWYLHEQDGQRRILVENNDPNEVSLSFTGFNQENQKSSAQLVALGPASQTAQEVARQDITDVVRDFTIEQMPNPYVAIVTANRDRTGVSLLNTRMISTVLADLLIGRPLAIPGGMNIELRRNQSTHGYELVISGAVAVINLQYSILVRGQAISGTAPASSGREANQQLIIGIPAAFSFELIDSVRLYYEVPLTVYEQEGRRTRGRRSAAALASA
jgi:hypothetical protein